MRNLILSIFAVVVMALPLMLTLADRVEGILPNEILGEETEYLKGSLSTSEGLSDLANWSSFKQGKFQAHIEERLDAHIPLQADALLGYSAIQRFFISQSNLLCRFDCYPAFYGNTTVYIPQQEALSQFAAPAEKLVSELIPSFGEKLSSFAIAHQDVQFVICLADAAPYSEANPSNGLISGTSTTSECLSALRESLDPAASNISVVGNAYTNADSFFRNFYTTDHHWNGYGAYEAYKSIFKDSQAVPTLGPTDDSSLSGLIMNGSQARRALCLLDEPLNEPEWNLDALDVAEGSSPVALDPLSRRETLLEDGLAAEFNFYHTYYGPSAFAKIENTTPPLFGNNALIIGDSFTSAIQWLIATEHDQTQTILDAWDSGTVDARLEDRIEQADCDVVYFVGSPNAISNIMQKPVDYFEAHSQPER